MSNFIKLITLGFAASALVAAGPIATRPEADIARDADRKPAAMVAFAKIKPGQTVYDLLPGRGYFTRVFSQAVGPKGAVHAVVPAEMVARRPEAANGIKEMAAEPGYGNVTVDVKSLNALGPDSSADLAWTSLNYHDLHNPNSPADTLVGVNKAVFALLKPGGLYVVVDHVAAAGSGLRDVSTLHRIDPAIVKAEVLAAGFVFDGESKVLAHAADDHTLKVMETGVRGKTDQFAYRFRKPRK